MWSSWRETLEFHYSGSGSSAGKMLSWTGYCAFSHLSKLVTVLEHLLSDYCVSFAVLEQCSF